MRFLCGGGEMGVGDGQRVGGGGRGEGGGRGAEVYVCCSLENLHAIVVGVRHDDAPVAVDGNAATRSDELSVA